MTIQSSTLRPGLLVSMKTSASGNVRYQRQLIENRTSSKGVKRVKTLTTATTFDPKEQTELTYARSRARSIVGSVCTGTEFGWICPANSDNEKKLEAAIKEAKDIARTFNAKAKFASLNVYVLIGRIASDDVEALKAINSEVRETMEQMTEGVKNLDAKSIRKAADQARRLGTMLGKDAQSRIQTAIEAARETASEIVKAGETMSIAVDKETLKTLSQSRTAFLDMDGERKVRRAKSKSRSVDFAPASTVKTKRAKSAQRQLELE